MEQIEALKQLTNVNNLRVEHFEEKAWGWKYNVQHSKNYRTDYLYFVNGGYTSKHFHHKKMNIIFCILGTLKIEYLAENTHLSVTKLIGPSSVSRIIHLKPRTIHRLTAIGDTIVIEIDSTLGDVNCNVDDIQRMDTGGILNELSRANKSN